MGIGFGGGRFNMTRGWLMHMIDQQTTSDHPGAKNHHGGQNDFPGIHWGWSLWSTDASRVLSKFWERSSVLVEAVELKNAHAPSNKAMATLDTAACQNPRTHAAR